MYSRLDQVMGFGVPYPDDFESGLLTSMFNRNHITGPHMSADTGQQSTTLTNPACLDLLLEKVPRFVPAVYGDDEAFVFSRLMSMLHRLCVPMKNAAPLFS
jgi:hypothetical protein